MKKILIVEDEVIIARDEEDKLKTLGYNIVEIVSNGEDAVKKAKSLKPDIILMDINLKKEMDGIDAAAIIHEQHLAPVIFITGYTDEETLRRAQKTRPYGFIKKPFDLTSIGITIKMAIHQFKVDEKLQKAEEKFRSIFENKGTATGIFGEDSIIKECNAVFEEMCGYSRSEIINKMKWSDFVVKEDLERMQKYHAQRLKNGDSPPSQYECGIINKNGEILNVIVNINITGKERIVSLTNITERKRTETIQQIQYEIANNAVKAKDLDEFYTTARKSLGREMNTQNFFVAMYDETTDCFSAIFEKDEKDHIPEWRADKSTTGQVTKYKKSVLLTKEEILDLADTGEIELIGTVPECWLGVPLKIGDNVLGVIVVQDYSDPGAYDRSDLELLEMAAGTMSSYIERKKAVEEKDKIQKQLLQTQKLESIGTLAGGVAHDFNNILTVIIGYSDMILSDIEKSNHLFVPISSINKAANRAAKLTSQLLLFSRQQEMEYKVINLNNTINNLYKMLIRLIGEDISIHNDFADDLWQIKADEGQMEQVLTNLTVNARNAMPNGGHINISTKNILIDEDMAKSIPDIIPGKYIMLSVDDTGTGIEKDIQEKIFDPFFTTKGLAEGTGMGLSVVLGIIKQHKGLIKVYSESGQGAHFNIYIPALSDIRTNEIKEDESDNIQQYQGNGETILLVEDDEMILDTLQYALEDSEYIFYSAQNGELALQIFKKENIDLVISDVIMPGMNGIELADRLREEKKELKVILSSGYSDHKVASARIREKGYKFIQKPYEIKNLLKLIQDLLGKG